MGHGKQNIYAGTQCEAKPNSSFNNVGSSKYCPVTSLHKTFNFLKLEDIYQLQPASS